MLHRVTSITVLALSASLGCKSSSPTEILCGGAMNFACPSDMYCHLNDSCGGIDGEGVCKPRPLKCPPERDPVCGCDGETYSSACFAAARGVTQKSKGACVTSSATEQAIEANLEAEEELDNTTFGDDSGASE